MSQKTFVSWYLMGWCCQIRLPSWKLFCIYLVHNIVLYTATISISYIYLYYITCSPKVLFEDDIALGGIC